MSYRINRGGTRDIEREREREREKQDKKKWNPALTEKEEGDREKEGLKWESYRERERADGGGHGKFHTQHYFKSRKLWLVSKQTFKQQQAYNYKQASEYILLQNKSYQSFYVEN